MSSTTLISQVGLCTQTTKKNPNAGTYEVVSSLRPKICKYLSTTTAKKPRGSFLCKSPSIPKHFAMSSGNYAIDLSNEAYCPEECVEFAERLADSAAEVVKKYFRVPIEIQIKMDKSPVTVADETVEDEIKKMIRSKFPDHDILGEEKGLELGSGNGDYVWVIDPIDGTASFITGKPLFGVLIALVYKGVPVLGILDQPILKERWIGIRNGPDLRTTFNGSPVKTRSCQDISSAYLYTTSPHLFSGESNDAFTRLRNGVRRANYGCDCYAFGLLSLGFVDVVVEYGMKPWDYLALVPIVEGSGGLFTDWKGQPLRLDSRNPESWVGECLASGDSAVHSKALKLLNWGNE